MRIDEINTKITTLDRDVKVRVMTPDGYEKGDMNYPVLYINDGQDVFRDDQTFWGAESLRFEQYYKDYGRFLPPRDSGGHRVAGGPRGADPAVFALHQEF